MNKKALRQDFKIEIIKSFNRFFSILLIVALGVAFFSGIRASEPDMRISADKYYDDSNLMDIRVLSTLGLTDDDVRALRKVDGIKEVNPGYSLDVICNTGDTELVIKVLSLTESINQYNVIEGRLPETNNECLVDSQTLRYTDYKIGDTIKFRSGTDENLNKNLNNTQFKIVGIGNSSTYLSYDRGTSSIGNGKINSFVVVPAKAFKLDAYTEIYATVEGAKEFISYTDEYEDAVKKVTDHIEKIKEARIKARYDEIRKEPTEEIKENEQKLKDSEIETDQKLQDAANKIKDGKKKIADGNDKISDGWDKLNQGKKELAENKNKLLASEQELKTGQTQINSAEKEIKSGKAVLEEKRKEYKDGATALNDGFKQWETALTDWNKKKKELDSKEIALTSALKELTAQKEQLEPVKDSYPDKWQELLKTEAELLKNQEEIKLYQTQLTKGKQQLDATKKTLDKQQVKLDAADQKLTTEEKKLTAGAAALSAKKKKLEEGQARITEGWASITKAERDIAGSGAKLKEKEKEIKKAQATLKEKEKEYEEGVKKAEKEFRDARKKIADAKKKLEDVDYPKWYILDRNSLQTYVEYGLDSERIGNIGKIFPVIFFLVAALVSLTTMTRMVEEQRTQIGTLKALGYCRRSIAGKYLLYALLASFSGSILGVLIGEKILPQVIITAYVILYQSLPEVITPYNMYYAVLSTGIAVFCTTLATYFSCYQELRSTPAILMRPVAPKLGKRVLLERIPWLWKQFNFTMKATIRNLMRYKKRFFMTVFGIGGCMSLLLVGFGLKDSIGAISDIQYVQLWYQDAVITAKDSNRAEDTGYLEKQLKTNQQIKETIQIHDKTIDAENGKIIKSVSLIIPENTKEIKDFIVFRDRITHKNCSLSNDGVIITEKLASLLKVKKGDTISLKDGDAKRVQVKIDDIVENYMLHYIFMAPGTYQQLYQKNPEYNRIYLKYPDNVPVNEKKFAADILELPSVTAITFTSDAQKQITDMLNSLNLVIYVLIISAGLLAFIVLYNLNNININERKRELATLKVLGFEDMEVAAYVYRENILLTLIGAIFGIFLGLILHRFVILTTEIDAIMFGRKIKAVSFLFSLLLTSGFSVFVNYVMFYKLRKIDMVESLKSVE